MYEFKQIMAYCTYTYELAKNLDVNTPATIQTVVDKIKSLEAQYTDVFYKQLSTTGDTYFDERSREISEEWN